MFLTGIGGALRSGQMHDGRAPDYDDWSLNGDILLYDPLLDIALEVSSMGIRVDPDALRRQLAIRGCEERAELPFQKALLNGELPQTMGGGIGQSRMCVYLLRKAHVGEVAGEPVAAGRAGRVQEGKYSAAVSKAMRASLKCGLSPCFIIPYEIAPSCRDSRRCPICFILHDPPPKCFLTYACLSCCVTHAFLSEFAFC